MKTKMDYKFTKNGKKVAVIGKLNSDQWIVQEIFVANGQEYPAGENFLETTLLDAPAETWQVRDNKKQELRAEELKKEIEKLEKNRRISSQKSDVINLTNSVLKEYQSVNLDELTTLVDFVTGKITHLVLEHYSDYKILSLDEALKDEDNWNGYSGLDGLKLVSLFGCRKDKTRYEQEGRKFNLDYRINQYRDGSGSWTTIYPCKSYEEAVKKLDDLIGNVSDKHISDRIVDLKTKYNLQNPSAEKIRNFIISKIEAKEKYIQDKTEELQKTRDEINALKEQKAKI